MLIRQVSDKGGFTVIAFIKNAACLYVTTGQELAASAVDLFCKVLEIVIGTLVDDRPPISVSLCRIPDDQALGFRLELAKQFIIDRFFHDHTRSCRTLLSLQAKR